MQNKDIFLKIYSSLPLGVRKEIISVLPDFGPITWEVAYLEVSNETKVGEVILEKLNKMGII